MHQEESSLNTVQSIIIVCRISRGTSAPYMTMLCLLMFSSAATAAVAAVRFGSPLLRPLTFENAIGFEPICPSLPCSESVSTPSLSSSLTTSRERDLCINSTGPVPEVDEEEPAVVALCNDDVDPVVRVGGPGEYIAAAEPGLEDEIQKNSAEILSFPFPLFSSPFLLSLSSLPPHPPLARMLPLSPSPLLPNTLDDLHHLELPPRS